MKKAVFLLVLVAIMLVGVTAFASTGSALDESDYTAWFKANYNKFNVPYSMDESTVNIDGVSGQMTVCESDLFLPGKNGLDLNIVREHQSIGDLVRISNERITSDGEFILARYILPDGQYKLVRFYTADEYYENGEDGIYISSQYENTNTNSYINMDAGSIYLPRDTSYVPNLSSFDRTYSKYETLSMAGGTNRINLENNWYITIPYADIIVDSYYNGIGDEMCRYQRFKLTNGVSLVAKETYIAYSYEIFTYGAEFQATNDYKMIAPYDRMDNDPIVDEVKGITYMYAIQHKEGNIWYYDEDGKFVAEEDKYGNMIKYQYSGNNVIITDTMGRVVTIDGDNKKITLTINGETDDVVYYETEEKDDQENDFSDYYSTFLFKVKKRENNETRETCSNVTTYEMKQRQNLYDGGVYAETYVPTVENVYLIHKIIKPDGAYSEYNYEKAELSNTKSYPLWEHLPSSSKDVSSNNETSNAWKYSFVQDETKSINYTKTRDDNNYYVTERYNVSPAKLLKKTVEGDGVKFEEEYIYNTGGSLYTQYLLKKVLRRNYNTQSADESDVINYFWEYDYDNRDNRIYENYMGQEIWYDYGSESNNPYNILLSKKYKKDSQMLKIENTCTSDKKSISDTKDYIEENGEFVLKNHTSYEYDLYGNITKVTQRPDSDTVIENNIIYTYNLPEYSVEKYMENVESYDGALETKISTLEEYDKYGNLEAVTDGNGNKTVYTYDKLGRILSVKNPDNTTQTYSYDVTENEVTAINENGTKIKQTYDMRGRELSAYVYNPNTQQYVKLREITYNENNGQVQSVMSLGAENREKITDYTWDDVGRIKTKQTKAKQANNNYSVVDKNTYSYDFPQDTGAYLKASGDASDVEKPSYELNYYNVQKYFTLNKEYDYFMVDVNVREKDLYISTLDDNGKQIQSVKYNDDNGKTTHTCVLNAKDVNRVKIFVSSYSEYSDSTISNIVAYTKEDLDNISTKVTSQTVGDSSITPAKTEQIYDFWGNLINQKKIDSSTGAVLAEENWTYDSLGNNLTYKNPVSTSNTTAKTFDYAGNVLTETTYDNKYGNFVTTNVYDNIGRLLSTSNTLNEYTYEYDKLGRIMSENHCATGGVKYKYDNNGNVIRKQETVQQYGSTDLKYNTTDYEYDNRNRLVKITQYKSGITQPEITQYYYDNVGNVLRMYTGLSAPLTINGLDNVTAGGDSDYSVNKYQYNYLNQLISQTDALNQSEYFDYDYLGNVLTKTDRNGNIIAYTYNWRSQPLTITSTNDNVTISYTYDRLGNRKTMVDSKGTANYKYDSLSRLVYEGKTTVVKRYSYNANGDRTSFLLNRNTVDLINTTYEWTNTGLLASITSGEDSVEYTYDAAGRITQEQMGDIITTKSYNESGCLQRIRNKCSNVIDSVFNYTLLSNGNVSYFTSTYADEMSYLTGYTYDGVNRLVTEQTDDASAVNNAYAYDDYGNRSAIANQKNYTYDLNNRLLIESGNIGANYQYDNNGNLYSKANWSLTDTTGTETEEIDVSETSAGYSQYTYDGLNRLVKVTDGSNTYTYEYDGDGRRAAKIVNGVRTNYMWDGDYIVAEMTSGIITTYIRGNKLHISKTGDDKKYYLYNGHGDVVQLLDGNYNVVEEYKYDAFGNQLTETTDKNPFRYCGEYYDAETGLIYLRARYYDTNVGRFISEDPIKDGLNWYVYGNNNPVMFVDPSGLISAIFVSSNMSDQADVRKEYYTEKYETDSYKIVVDSAEDFVKKWNNFFTVVEEIGETIDAIEIISHGSIDGKAGKSEDGTAYSTGYIYFTDEQKNKLYARNIDNMKKGDRSVADLRTVVSKELNISSCNGANKDTYNVIYGFMQIVDAQNYSGFDGGAQWNEDIGDHIAGGGYYDPNRPWYKGGPWYYVKTYQHTWWKHVEKANGIPIREREGRRYFGGGIN